MMSELFIPPRRILMGPGPSDVSPRVLGALARPTVGHLDPSFVGLMDEVKELLQYTFQTRNDLTFPVSAPGSAGMETCFVNLLEPGDTAIVCRNGVFGDRMKANVERCGATAVVVDDEWGRPVDPGKVAAAIREHPRARLVAFVHAETSTGARSDAAELCRLARDAGMLSVVDTVTSLGGIEVAVDAWGADAVYSGTQKCLSCVPGLSPVTFSERAAEVVRNRRHPVQSWFLDLNLVLGYWGGDSKRTYHHTAPVNSIYALHEALLMLHEEGLRNAWERHRLHHRALAAGLEALGLSFVVPEGWRLPQLNTVTIPDGVDDAVIRGRLLGDFGLEIGAGLGAFAGRAWRIGLLGQSACRGNVMHCLNALQSLLTTEGSRAATDAAATVYEERERRPRRTASR
ncbi:MAG TPA: alanine--glyoxylate aminotransferase family protein [Gammaproteobacteria bacterium]|nr:alanine--glyoxylate aminotransferase family protein [Gammaproteobacteria bacterium]